MRALGLHLRIDDRLIMLAHQALRLDLKTFQCFLIHQKTKRLLTLTNKEVAEFLSLRDKFNSLYVHGAYWINLCGKRSEKAYATLQKELALAKRLMFTHYLLHPGSANGWHDRMHGIDTLVRLLNTVLKNESDITIVLENTPHDGNTIGGDLNDFKYIRKKLDHPEKVSFCIDTAHAFAFGYDIVMKQDDFIALLDKTIGIKAIELIHLNDTKEKLGLKRDRHDIVGQGNIGSRALRKFVCDKRFRHIPIIMELPPLPDQEYLSIMNKIRNWDIYQLKMQ
jgi:deoxyribonuclease IV